MLARIPILGNNVSKMPYDSIKSMRERCAQDLQACTDEAPMEADYLIAHVLQSSRAQLYAWPERKITTSSCAQIEQLVARRIRGEPLAYVLGHQEFWSLQLAVTPDVLIPRADTERLVEVALEKLAKNPTPDVLDLGTGSGAIALAIANEIPGAHVVATDASKSALKVAQTNATQLKINLTLIHSNWFQHVNTGPFDLIVSNPPYVDHRDPDLEDAVRRFEPLSAVVSDASGLADLTVIVDGAANFLKPNGTLLLEHGWQQDVAVRALLQNAGFDEINTWQDLHGHPRVTGGTLTT